MELKPTCACNDKALFAGTGRLLTEAESRRKMQIMKAPKHEEGYDWFKHSMDNFRGDNYPTGFNEHLLD